MRRYRAKKPMPSAKEGSQRRHRRRRQPSNRNGSEKNPTITTSHTQHSAGVQVAARGIRQLAPFELVAQPRQPAVSPNAQHQRHR